MTDFIEGDAKLASKMVILLRQELKESRQRVEELERALAQEKQASTAMHDSKDAIERAEAAEVAMGILQRGIEKVGAENQKLRSKLEKYRARNPRRVKTEIVDQDNINSPEANEIQNSPDRETVERIAEIEQSVEKYKEKYRQQREAKRGFRESCNLLEAQIEALSAEKDSLVRQSKEREKAHKETLNHLNQTAHLKTLSRSDYVSFMDKFPCFENLPSYLTLNPVCHKGVDLEKYLGADDSSAWSAKKMLFLPGRLSWLNNHHHALAFGPLYRYDNGTKSWFSSSIFYEHYDKNIEVFFEAERLIYYAGTYKCHNIRDWNVNGCHIQPDTSPQDLADSTICLGGPHNLPGIMWDILPRLYTDGVLKVECMGLQCVGFRNDLYDSLSRRFQINNPIRKRKRDLHEPSPWPTKKVQKNLKGGKGGN